MRLSFSSLQIDQGPPTVSPRSGVFPCLLHSQESCPLLFRRWLQLLLTLYCLTFQCLRSCIPSNSLMSPVSHSVSVKRPCLSCIVPSGLWVEPVLLELHGLRVAEADAHRKLSVDIGWMDTGQQGKNPNTPTPFLKIICPQ